jgi:eukaryotic-like serine/threonine-protein kinase
MMTLTPGSRFGAFEIIELLGAGGMGEVYRARDSKLNRDVALKVLPLHICADPDRIVRFRREAQALATLKHPNIGAIHGVEEADGQQALVLELIDGKTLADRLAGGPLPPAEALSVAMQVAGALEASHDKGIVHRDLKPANIKLTPEGHVKVLDFGLAKVRPRVGGEPASLATQATQSGVGTVLGTPAYMAPEQARGLDTNRSADVWAFGCVLFEMLAGKPAFQGKTTTEILAEVLKSGTGLELPANRDAGRYSTCRPPVLAEKRSRSISRHRGCSHRS